MLPPLEARLRVIALCASRIRSLSGHVDIVDRSP